MADQITERIAEVLRTRNADLPLSIQDWDEEAAAVVEELGLTQDANGQVKVTRPRLPPGYTDADITSHHPMM